MKKKVSLLLLLLFLFLVPALFSAFGAGADEEIVAGVGHWDGFVYVPGLYDMTVWCHSEDATYQWCARVDNDMSWLPLVDNDAYSGTQTPHLQMTTADHLAYSEGSDWSVIRFSCRVTVGNKSVMVGDSTMWIGTHASLLRRLEEDGVVFSYVGLTQSSFVSAQEIDGTMYYEVNAGQAILPTWRYGTLASDYQTQSEVSVDIECYFTENGKTFKYDRSSGNGYTPSGIGKGRVTMRADLVLFVNGERMETLDSKTVVIDVITPPSRGAALTKGAVEVLAERYGQAAVRARLEKNTYVRLLEDCGSYWKVAVGDVWGYVPSTALNILGDITAVGLTIGEPAVYASAPTDVTLDDPDLYELFPTDPVVWTDSADGHILKNNEVFQPGHTYTVSIWLKAKNGKRFDVPDRDPTVTAQVNGDSVSAKRAYEQDPEEVIEVQYTFTHIHDLTKVPQKQPTCTTDGKRVHYRCGCGALFEDHEAKVRITDEGWGIIPAIGHHASEWKSNGTEHYKFCLRRECEEVLEETRGAHQGGKATCTHRAVCSVCGLEYGSLGSHVWSSGWEYADETGHAHVCTELCGAHGTVQPHRPGPAATATTPQVCLDCGYVIRPASSHTHILERVAAGEPGCTRKGNIEYYICIGCGKCFSDASGKNEVSKTSVILEPLGHTASETWSSDGASHWHVCERCGVLLEDTSEAHRYDGTSRVCSVCGYEKPAGLTEKEPETTESGNGSS
ncbi:MAG: hypothetical protein II797_02735, partial [Clostridia bacterium]|nr:hypothetical protein [Clostridia bacterium]